MYNLLGDRTQMKVIKVNGSAVKVFVLIENDKRIVYIPVKALERVDYNQLVGIEEKGGDMLREMSNTVLENGKNALAFYEDIIQVMVKETGERIRKPHEPKVDTKSTPADDLYAVLSQLLGSVQPAPKTTTRTTKTKE